MAAHRKSHSKVSNLKKAVFGFAAASLIAVGGVSTISAFSDSADSNITVKAGSIELQVNNTKSVAVALPTTLKPGETVPAKTFTISNKGTLPLTYTVKSATGAGELAGALNASIKTSASATAVSSKLNAVNIPATTLAPGATETFSITVNWPSTASDNNFQGKDGATTLEFVATS